MSEFYPFAPRESQLEEYREDARRSFSRIGWACFAMMLVMQGGAALLMLGCSENNDAFYVESGKIKTRTNHHGGILGGISSGMPILFRAAVKPTPSIGLEQDSVRMSAGINTKLKISGRHDPCILPRAVPCVEAAAAIAVYDTLLNSTEGCD